MVGKVGVVCESVRLAAGVLRGIMERCDWLFTSRCTDNARSMLLWEGERPQV